MSRLRRIFRVLSAAVGLLVAAFVVFVLWLLWPDANRLTGYAARGDTEGVRLCIRLGVDPNTPSKWGWHRENDGQTPLTAAAQHGRADVVGLLIRYGANPDLRDGGFEYPHHAPLETAAMAGRLEVCRVLLEAGADPNLPNNPKQTGSTENWTALDWALQAKAPEVAGLLRRHGAVESGRRVVDLR